ncbi:MAG: NAD-dependent epimerase/dehydratase family protein [Sulfolobales archaeon]
MKILVTGGAGFIGGNVLLYLRRRGYEVDALDSLERASPEIFKLLKENNVMIYVEDLRASSRLREIVNKYDVIIHAAAYIDVKESIENPWIYMENNYLSTYRLSEALDRRQMIVYLSSASVYGDSSEIPLREDSPKKPISPYGLSKLLGEEALIIGSLCKGFRYSILRLFNVYGPGQSRSYAGVISIFIDRVLRDQPPIIFGDGMNMRDFIHVRDVARVIELILERPDVSGIFNVGSGVGVSIGDLARLIIRLAGKEGALYPQYAEPRPGDIRVSIASIDKLKKILGFTPEISLEKGLEELIKMKRNEVER